MAGGQRLRIEYLTHGEDWRQSTDKHTPPTGRWRGIHHCRWGEDNLLAPAISTLVVPVHGEAGGGATICLFMQQETLLASMITDVLRMQTDFLLITMYCWEAVRQADETGSGRGALRVAGMWRARSGSDEHYRRQGWLRVKESWVQGVLCKGCWFSLASGGMPTNVMAFFFFSDDKLSTRNGRGIFYKEDTVTELSITRASRTQDSH